MILKFCMWHLPLSPLCIIYKTLTTLKLEQKWARVCNFWIGKLKTQIEISLLAFMFRVDKSKVSGIFNPWKSACFVLMGGWCVLCVCVRFFLLAEAWGTSHDRFLDQREPLWSAYLNCSSFLESLWFCLAYCFCYTRYWLYLEDTCKPLSVFHT